MRRLRTIVLGMVGAAGIGAALAQTPVIPVYKVTNTGGTGYQPVDATHPLPTTTVSGVSGFAYGAAGTPLSVDSTGETGTIPSPYTTFVLTNVGTKTAYCKPGAGPATTSDQVVFAGSYVQYQTGSATQFSCIASGSDTTTINVVGGSGQASWAFGGAVAVSNTPANPLYVAPGTGATFPVTATVGTFADGWNVTEGTKADAAWSGTGSGSLIAIVKYMAAGIYSTANVQGVTASGVSPTENPTYNGGLATTSNPTAVSNGQKVAMSADKYGRGITSPWAPVDQWTGTGGSTTSGSAITVISASGSGSIKEYMTGLQCGRSDAGTTAITVAVTDGTKTRTYVLPNNGGGGGNNMSFSPPEIYAANQNVTATPSGGSISTIYCYAQGFYAP